MVAAVAFVARAAVALWAGSRFPPAADGTYYDVLARRIAEGRGYTWAWPDGSVTPVAHYPVGFPALLGALYAVFGAHPWLASWVNVLAGVGTAFALHRLALRATTERRALLAGIAVALHPALVLYVPALMTELVATGLVAGACALAAPARDARRPWAWLGGSGLLLGAATLVRPQSIVLAPALGALAAPPAWRCGWLRGAALATGIALAACAPWTARNCKEMHRCALVSVNGGWNLLIGTQTESGGWQEIDVPPECRAVWDEAEKDACFERAGRRTIAAHPGAWLARVPAKLRTTLDYFGAGPWYLHASNGAAFGEGAKAVAAVVEIVVTRALLLAALLAIALSRAAPRAARGMAAIGCFLSPTHDAWLGYVALALALVLAHARARTLLALHAAAVLFATFALHATFFGAGRYGLVVAPFVAALAFVRPRAPV
jgi:4-amino-4-deoxy-L-arabinose transferase-like glycosyltransferase